MPTENLLDPPVFLGVLRVLARHENMSPSNPTIADELAIVQIDTQTPVDLVRTPERNLIRNSGYHPACWFKDQCAINCICHS